MFTEHRTYTFRKPFKKKQRDVIEYEQHLRNINLNVSKMHRRERHDQKTIQIQSHLWRSREKIQMRLILQDCRIDSCMDSPGHPFSNRERNPLRVP